MGLRMYEVVGGFAKLVRQRRRDELPSSSKAEAYNDRVRLRPCVRAAQGIGAASFSSHHPIQSEGATLRRRAWMHSHGDSDKGRLRRFFELEELVCETNPHLFSHFPPHALLRD
jgi:hypothetical protein